MKKQHLFLTAIISSGFALPVFACGPSTAPMGSNTTSNEHHHTGSGREHWRKKRIKHLRHKLDEYNNAQKFANGMDGVDGHHSAPDPEEKHRYWVNRYEFLALKAEAGQATVTELHELRWLQGKLLHR